MKPIWQLEGNDVIGLQGDSPRFIRLVNALLAQTSTTLPHSAIHLNVNDHEPDGGVDAAIDSAVPGDPTGYLGMPTCWQYKAQPTGNIKPEKKKKGGQETALRDEIGKPYVKDLIVKGYAYRFCISDDMPAAKKSEWEGWLTDEARKIDPRAQPARVVTASDLALWASRYPAIVAGYFRTFLVQFNSLNNWHQELKALTPTFVPPTSWVGTFASVQAHIDFSRPIQTILTIQGEAGVGKSRNLCEALLGNPSLDALVVATSNEGQALEFAQIIARNPETQAVLVADECSVAFRKRIANLVPSCAARFRVIAIDNSLQRAGAAGELRLEHLNEDEAEKILTKNFPELPSNRLRSYASLARGFVRLAVDLCRNDHLVPSDGRIDQFFGSFHSRYLQNRLSGEELEAVELISLLPRVGYRDEVKTELEGLCALPPVGLRALDIVRTATKLKQSPGFIAFGGRYLYVTPTLIAQVAFQAAWDRWIAPDPTKSVFNDYFRNA